jgi:hypothetical protein
VLISLLSIGKVNKCEFTCGKKVVEFMGVRRFLVDTSSDPHPLCIVRVLEVEGRS